MAEIIRLMLQMKSSSTLAAASFGSLASAPFNNSFPDLQGVEFDTSFSPVPIPSSPLTLTANFRSSGLVPETPTYVVRAAVEAGSMDNLISMARLNDDIVGVFADPKIEPISICPSGPIGTDKDVENLLNINELRLRGLDGAGVHVVIVDTGVNIGYLANRGKTPNFNLGLSWGPITGQPLGNMTVGHGTMCAYDVCIAAPACTVIDHPVLTSQRGGGSAMDGLLSDAVASYGFLLSHMTKAPEPFAGDHIPRTLVVNNSWGMFHPSWDFPVGSPQNYSDNALHPFNIIVESLEAAGADILFAAGNCGTECADSRCRGNTTAGIMGANSSDSVICVGGVMIDKQRIGYSTKGPGRLSTQKPDLACFTHFAGSGVYSADGGTSAATPVAAGVVAAIRKLYPSSILSPANLRQLFQECAELGPDQSSFNFEYGHGILSVSKILSQLDAMFPSVTIPMV